GVLRPNMVELQSVNSQVRTFPNDQKRWKLAPLSVIGKWIPFKEFLNDLISMVNRYNDKTPEP
ncbi:hypothetical protein ACEN3Q_10405, partial [Limosilactobacillus fermentum]|uniref:hypothetical protein n=1 Tax=Limosilactobacillus fermentum TaxID=1613 RepID=UPI002072C0EF